MRVGTAIAIVVIFLFFGLPILTGYAPFPTDPSPDHVGDFFGGIWDYWSEVFKVVSQRSNPTDQQTVDQQTVDQQTVDQQTTLYGIFDNLSLTF